VITEKTAKKILGANFFVQLLNPCSGTIVIRNALVDSRQPTEV